MTRTHWVKPIRLQPALQLVLPSSCPFPTFLARVVVGHHDTNSDVCASSVAGADQSCVQSDFSSRVSIPHRRKRVHHVDERGLLLRVFFIQLEIIFCFLGAVSRLLSQLLDVRRPVWLWSSLTCRGIQC